MTFLASTPERVTPEIKTITADSMFAGQQLRLKVQVPIYHRNPDLWHRHDGFYELVICRSGSALQESWNCDGFDMIHGGMCYLLTPGTIHRYRRINDFHHYNILFDAKLAPVLFPRIVESGKNGLFATGKDKPQIFSLSEENLSAAVKIVEDIHRELFQKHPGFIEVCHADMVRLFIHLFRYCDHSDRGVDQRNDRIAAVVRMMESSCENHYTLESLAKSAGMSISCFRHNFALVTGVSPIAYLNRLRLKKGAMLLTLSGSISSVASRCGMCDSNYFTKMFHRASGMTPSAFRRQAATMDMDEFMRRFDEA